MQLLGLVVIAVLAGCVSNDSPSPSGESLGIRANHPYIQYSGRSVGQGTSRVTLGYSGARVRMRFKGTAIGMWMDDDSGENYAMTWIDGLPGEKFRLNADNGYYQLAQGLADGEHIIEVVRVTECNFGLNHFRGFQLGAGSQPLEWNQPTDRKIEFIGDSITCGYGVEVDDPSLHFSAESENFCLGYSGLVARQLDADYLVVSRSGIGMVRNYDGPYEGSENTMPQVYPAAFYLQDQPVWDPARFIPDVVCINLGTNDFSTTGVNVETFVSTYIDFGTMLLRRYPDAELVIIQGPMENGDALKNALTRVVGQLERQDASRVHYLKLSPQGSVGLGADYHPNRAQSRINATELKDYLTELMNWH